MWVVACAGQQRKGEMVMWRNDTLGEAEEAFCNLMESAVFDKHHDTCIRTCVKHAKEPVA